MSDLLALAGAAVAGCGLGLFFFGGLWMTVKQLPGSRRPVLLALGSFLGRLAVCALGFILVARGQWDLMLVCFLTFMAMRLMLQHRLGPGRLAR
jgi:F1F0 ATPase subunit 2